LHLGSSVLSRRSTCPGAFSLVFDVAYLGSLSPLRSLV
jgi:hypothetical protein